MQAKRRFHSTGSWSFLQGMAGGWELSVRENKVERFKIRSESGLVHKRQEQR